MFLCAFDKKTSVLGQSDIKKLRRENYQLRKEIWTLRDEYDRLGKLLKNKVDSTISDHSADCEFGDGCRCCDCCLDEVSLFPALNKYYQRLWILNHSHFVTS